MFRHLSRYFDLSVLFDAEREPNRLWNVSPDLGFRYTYAKGIAIPYRRVRPDLPGDDSRYFQLRYDLLPALWRFRPDVVVSGEMGPRSLQALLYCKLRNVPLVLWSEGTPHTEGWAPALKRSVRRWLVRSATRFWSNGIESSQLLRSYGAPGERLDEGLIGFDTHHLAAAVGRSLATAPELRRSLDLRGTVFLFVGQFASRKGVGEFLAALEALRAACSQEFSALFVGEGPLRPLLEAWAREHTSVPLRLVPFQQPDQLPPYYAAADVFVLPTLEDNWSMVALEAAVSGLPQVFSKFNGATTDLMKLGAPGECVDPMNTAGFAACLARYVEGAAGRAGAETVARIADAFSPEQCAGRARRSIEAALWTGQTG
ncbi:MAG TPA: glycosyltransferase family 4 protein [Bryobacteraceae bacterium]